LQKREKQARTNQQGVIDTFDGNTFLVLIDNMRSLWNVGSIFRTADAAGVSLINLCGITGCPPKKEITKTALGAEETVPWQYFVHPFDVIPQIKDKGICIVGLERNHLSTNLTDLLKAKKISKPLCLVVGNENQGLSPEILDYCDYVCSLPMYGKKESLNAAVAFGIAAYLINEFTN
jgi:tRNA G18 (ribose-2'-O)-methylase SpoU